MLFATYLTAIALTGASPSPSPCPYGVDDAVFQAYGSVKDSAAYVASLSGGDGSAYTASFIVFSPSGGQTVTVHVPGAGAGKPPRSDDVLFVTHREDVVWIQLASVTNAAGATFSNCALPTPIQKIGWTVAETFDDSASWIDADRVTAIAFAPPTATQIIEPEYPAIARREGWLGSCVVALAVSASGSVDDAEIVAGSGYLALDDAARKAAAAQTFAPARLPEALGGAAMSAVLFERIAYSPGLVTVSPIDAPL